jgi:uncharacterized metal-binding protein YceD (DUF177 family)
MNSPLPPYSAFLDLGAVPEHCFERTLSPSAEERQAIALWLGVEAVESLAATVRLKRLREHHYLYEARFDADLVQACVVTLAPVPAHLTGEFRRDFRVRPKTPAKRRRQAETAPTSVELNAIDDDESEWLDEHEIDLAGPLLEELTLALDPYPRAPGAEFEVPPEETAARDSPFAVLEKLKTDQTRPAGSSKKATNEPKNAQPTRKGK